MWKVDWNYVLNLQVGLLLLWKKSRTLCCTEKRVSSLTASLPSLSQLGMPVLTQVVLTEDSLHTEE